MRRDRLALRAAIIVVLVALVGVIGALVSARGASASPLIATRAVGPDPSSVVVDTRAGHGFVMNSSNNSVSMFDASTGRLLRVLPLGQAAPNATEETGAHLMAVDEAEGHVFVAASTASGASIRMLDTRTGTTLHTVRLSSNPDEVLLDARTGRVFVHSWNGSSLLLDARTRAVMRAFTLGVGVPHADDKAVVDERTGRIYVLSETLRDSTGAAVGTGRVLALDGATGRVLGAVPVGLLPRDLAVDSRTNRVFVSNVNDAESDRYGYRALAGNGSNPWSWVPQPIRNWLPQASQPQPVPTGPLSGTVSVIDTTR